MEHIINATHGDTIIIQIQAQAPSPSLQKIEVKADASIVQIFEEINKVCHAVDINILDLQSKKKSNILTVARQYIAKKLRTNYHMTLSEIGILLHKDHTSIMYYIRTYDDRLSINDAVTLNILKKIQDYEATKN